MSTAQQIAVSYDASSEFFALWLDRRMTYSCVLFEDAAVLDTAQPHKHAWHSGAAQVRPDKRVRDIGCGWGANLRYLTEDREVKLAHGITLSRSQYEYLVRANIPNARVECISYRDYAPSEGFDAVQSIGMLEHVANRDETAEGMHIDRYRDFFRRAWEWTHRGSWFSLQTVTTALRPHNRRHVREMHWVAETIFPGGCAPTVEAVAASVAPYWEIVTIRMRREHYARTTAEWRRRLRASERAIKERWGRELFDTYDRYLGACVMVFENGYHSLMQAALRRIDP